MTDANSTKTEGNFAADHTLCNSCRYQFPELYPELNADLPEQKPLACETGLALESHVSNTADKTSIGLPKIPYSTLRKLIIRSRERELERQRSISERQKQRGYEHGYKLGHAAGQKQGWESAWDESRSLHNCSAEKWTTLITGFWNELQDLHAATINNLSEPLLDLITHVSERVLNQELTASRDSIKRLLVDAVRKLPRSIAIDLYIHPNDKTILAPITNRLSELKIQEDESIAPGGFRLISTKGEVDATVQRRLKSCLDTVQETLSVQ